jgi:N-acetylneuraminic acid mutarotase
MVARQCEDAPAPRDDHTAILDNDSMVIFGGFERGKKCNSVYKYDFTSTTWTKLSEGDTDAPSPRSGHSACLWKNNMVVFGGIDANQNRLNDTWFFDLTKNKWTAITVRISDFYKPVVRSGHSASVYNDNYLVVFGGMTAVTKELDDVVVLNLSSYLWSQITEPNQTKSPEKPKTKMFSKLGSMVKKSLSQVGPDKAALISPSKIDCSPYPQTFAVKKINSTMSSKFIGL